MDPGYSPSYLRHLNLDTGSLLHRRNVHAPISYPQMLRPSAWSLPDAEFEILAVSRVYVKRGNMESVQLVGETNAQLGRNKTPTVETANDQDWKVAE